MTAYAASLRVYEPLAAFSGSERAHWESYLAAGTAPDRVAGARVEELAALRALPSAALPDPGRHAYVLEVDGVALVCPWRTRIRSAEALVDFRAGLPDEVGDAFVPRAVVAAAEQELDTWRAEVPDPHSHVMTSSWQVPLRWFILVEAAERSVALGAGRLGAGGPAPRSAPARAVGRELVYRTPMSRARRRGARALSVLRRTVDDGAVTAGVEDLGRWLEEFHPRSLVELDYGGLVHLQGDEQLTADESAADVAAALAALADGDAERAAAAYSRVTARMKALQAVESAS